MAGIGFELQKLNLRGDLAGRAGSIAHAAIVAVGPWIFTILAIGLISTVSERIIDQEALAEFRILVIYAFAISLIGTAAVGILATRMMSDAIYARRFPLISQLFVAGLLIGITGTSLLAVVIFLVVFDLPFAEAIGVLATCLMASQIWIAHAFCGAVRDYTGITLGFLIGLLVSVIASVMAAIHGFGAVGIIWGFNVGLALVYFMLASRVLLTFPHPVTDLRLALRSYYRAARDYWVVALAATVAVAAIWVDKWVMWLGPSGEYLGDSLLHAPLYDSAMFIAYLVIVPALSFFVMHLETDFFRNYQQFHASIRTHATLQQIEEQVQFLKRGTLISLIRIIVVQASLCAVLVLAVPMMIEVLRLQFRQIPILQFGAIGASFQFVFMACTSLLLFFDRQWTYLLLQLLFLGLNAGLTWLTLQFGIDYYGFGFLLASLVCSLSGVVALVTSFNGLNYHTFMKATDLRTSHNWIGMWQNADGAPRNTKADPATTLYSAGRGYSVSRGRSAIVSR